MRRFIMRHWNAAAARRYDEHVPITKPKQRVDTVRVMTVKRTGPYVMLNNMSVVRTCVLEMEDRPI